MPVATINSQDSESEEFEVKRLACNILPARVVLTILAFIGCFTLSAMRVNLSVALVAMVGRRVSGNQTNATEESCPELIIHTNSSSDNGTSVAGEFDWDIDIQGQVLGSFFYGYLLTQIPGGLLAEKYGAKWVFGIGILITSVFTLLSPLAARWSVWALVVARVIEGLAGGVTFPAMNVLIARWAPKVERSRISTAMNMGVQAGTVVTNVASGILCESTIMGGWPSAFYIFGILGCISFILWAFLVYETPETHPRISRQELDYIKAGQDEAPPGAIGVPWKQIWTSAAVWGIIIAHFGQNWVFYTLIALMPTYLSNVLHFSLTKDGIMSALPNLMMAVFAIPASIAADALRASGRLRSTTIRKLVNSIAFYGPGLCALGIAFTGCDPVLIIVLFSLSFGLNGLIFSGFMVNHIDLSPQFAGTLFGITNCIATIPGFLAPEFSGVILESGQTLRNWGIVYITTTVVHFLSATLYNCFASAELQPWNSATTPVPDPAPVPVIDIVDPDQRVRTTSRDSELEPLVTVY